MIDKIRDVLVEVGQWVYRNPLKGMPNTRYSATDSDGRMIYCDDLVTAYRHAVPDGSVYDMHLECYLSVGGHDGDL